MPVIRPSGAIPLSERLLGRGREGHVEVVAVDPPVMHTSLTTSASGTSRCAMRFEPTDDGTDEIDTIDQKVPASMLHRMADRLVVRRRLGRNPEQGTERFRAIVEAEVTAS